MAEIQLSLGGDERSPQVRALYEWLRDDLGARRPAGLALRAEPPGPGRMGAGEFLLFLLDNPEWIGVVADSVARWYETLHRRPTLRVRQNGREYIVENVTVEELRRILGEEPGDEDGGEERNGTGR